MSDGLEHSDPDQIDLATVLAALADPGRLATVRTPAAEGELCSANLCEVTGLECTKSTLSHHLKILRGAGLTRTRPHGARRDASLRRDYVNTTFPVC
jgi:DNA-binding transcriptional ArsR family regulator